MDRSFLASTADAQRAPQTFFRRGLDDGHGRLRHDPNPYGGYALEFTEADRRSHARRSLKMTLITLAIGLSLFVLFLGLVTAIERL